MENIGTFCRTLDVPYVAFEADGRDREGHDLGNEPQVLSGPGGVELDGHRVGPGRGVQLAFRRGVVHLKVKRAVNSKTENNSKEHLFSQCLRYKWIDSEEDKKKYLIGNSRYILKGKKGAVNQE